MRTSNLLLLSAFALLAACSDQSPGGPETSGSDARPVGSDRDEHGCITSAGYHWCAAENECVRPWELAKEKGFEPTPEAIEEYCGTGKD